MIPKTFPVRAESAATSLHCCCGSLQGGVGSMGWDSFTRGVENPLLPGYPIGLKTYSAELQIA